MNANAGRAKAASRALSTLRAEPRLIGERGIERSGESLLLVGEKIAVLWKRTMARISPVLASAKVM